MRITKRDFSNYSERHSFSHLPGEKQQAVRCASIAMMRRKRMLSRGMNVGYTLEQRFVPNTHILSANHCFKYSQTSMISICETHDFNHEASHVK